MAAPADRQRMARWLRGTLLKPRDVPPRYADSAVFLADRGSQIVLAIDLADAVSPALVEQRLKASDILKRGVYDPQIVAQRLVSLRSAYFAITVGETIEGKIKLDFGLPADYLIAIAKDMLKLALDDAGATLPDLNRWRTSGKDTSIILEGPLTEESTRRILSLVQPPMMSHDSFGDPSRNALPEAAKAAPAPAREPLSHVEAQKRYFRAVVDLLEGLRNQRAETAASMRLWYDRYAKRIDELPIVDVDADLLDFGGLASKTLREMSLGINYARNDQVYRIAGTPNVGGVVVAGYGYYGGGGTDKAYDASVIKKQSNAVLNTQLDATWKGIDQAVADMKRKLVERYKVEF